MISIQKQFIFVHVPKTGGNSIQNVLRQYSEDVIVTPTNRHNGIDRFGVSNTQFQTTKHSTLQQYKSAMPKRTYESLFKFATIRNPWDLMVSWYFSPHRGADKWDRLEFLKLIDSVPPLRHYVCEKSPAERFVEKYGERRNVCNIPINIQQGLSLLGFKVFSENRLNGDLDFLIRYEHLNEDFKCVCQTLDIPFEDLPKTNVSKREHYSKYYDEELRAIVGQRFRDEISFGGYCFEKA